MLALLQQGDRKLDFHLTAAGVRRCEHDACAYQAIGLPHFATSDEGQKAYEAMLAADRDAQPKVYDLEAMNDKDRHMLAATTADTELLTRVSEYEKSHRDEHLRFWLARNEITPAEIRAGLAEDENYHVRSVIAENEITPKETLERLAEDDEYYVREMVASNPAIPPDVLGRLLQDSEDHVPDTGTRDRGLHLEW